MKKFKTVFAVFLMLIFLTLNFFSVLDADTILSVSVEKPIYGVKDSLTVSGSAIPNSLVSIQLFNPVGKRVAVAQTETNNQGLWVAKNIYTFSVEDVSGKWTVKVFDPVLKEWGEANVYVDVKPPKLSIYIKPIKQTYKEEIITVLVSSNENLKTAPAITITQHETVVLETRKFNKTSWIGTYKIKPIEGEATIKVQAQDRAGNLAKKELSFMVDVTPPKVAITEIPARTEEATIIVKGVVDEPVQEVELEVPGLSPIKVPVEKEKLTWKTDVTLKKTGNNLITVKAVDKAGNIGKDSRVVFYVGPLEIIKTEMGAIRESINMISNLVMIAVILSIVAAVFSIVAVVTIVRRIVLK